MSIVQVLVGFGLATILGLVLAEMGTSSSRQSAQIRASIERAAVVQSLQAIISNSKVCELSVRKNVAIGSSVAVPASEASKFSTSYRVVFYLDNNTDKKVPIQDNTDVPGTALTTEWIRVFDPVPATSMNLTPPQRMYVATMKVKFRQKSAPKGSIDLKPVEVGKVFFITSNSIPNGTITECFGNNAGAYVCDPGEIQVVDSANNWSCKKVGEALADACTSGAASQLMKTTSTGDVSCQVYYRITDSSCDGLGAVSSQATCKSKSCTVTTTSGGGSTTISGTSIGDFWTPEQSVTIGVPYTTTTSSSGSGTSPSGGSTTTTHTSYVTFKIPSYKIPGYTIPDRTVPTAGSTTSVTRYHQCNGSAVCDSATPLNCPNAAL